MLVLVLMPNADADADADAGADAHLATLRVSFRFRTFLAFMPTHTFADTKYVFVLSGGDLGTSFRSLALTLTLLAPANCVNERTHAVHEIITPDTDRSTSPNSFPSLIQQMPVPVPVLMLLARLRRSWWCS